MLGEQWAKEHYLRAGYKFISQNTFNRKGKRFGEIDLVFVKNKILVFVEVKTRTSGSAKFGSGLEAVNFGKQMRLIKAVKWFISTERRFQDFTPRIDVCVIEVEDLDKQVYSVNIYENSVEDSS